MATCLSHQPVLLQEAIQSLAIKPEGSYIDATFGRGGHSRAILAALGPLGRLLALDCDLQAHAYAQKYLVHDQRFQFQRSNFALLAECAKQHAMSGQVDGILFDLGVSSPQLDEPERGFSFRNDGPLDMRMDAASGATAAQWLATVTEADLSAVLRSYGEERFAKRIARAIISSRQQQAITTTRQLADLISTAVPTREPGKHPATRSFQAIRIAVNQELTVLQQALEQTIEILAAYGRLVIISFHSLEDRLVKRFLRRQAGKETGLPEQLPITATEQQQLAKLRILKRVFPSAAEVQANSRARSAVMRVAERLP